MSQDSEESLRTKYIECFTEQLNEFEVLKSMYPNEDEIIITDRKALDDINNFVYSDCEYIPNHLDFVLNIIVNSCKLEICINLPSLYPTEEPDVCVRCNQLNRFQETSLNNDLCNYIKNNYDNEICLHLVVSWLQDNIDSYKKSDLKPKTEDNDYESNDDKFVRHWIYSHHIYNKKKRDEIIKNAKELNLTGFCLPGKPGVIVIEGPDDDCKEWWRIIKSLSWKKIMIRQSEIFKLSQANRQRKFDKFEQIHLNNPYSKHSRSLEMGAVFKYMEDHGLRQAFHEFLGLCNDSVG